MRFEEGRIEFVPTPGASPSLAAQLMKRLAEWTGVRWMVAVASDGGAPSLREQAESEAEAERDAVAADPLVRKVLETFPGSRIVAVNPLAEAILPPTLVGVDARPDDDIGYGDDVPDEDDL